MTASDASRKALTLPRLHEKRARGERMAIHTCYDATFAAVLDGCGVDLLLVGDSLGMVLQGHATTLPVTLEQMLHRHPPRFVRDCLAGQESIAYVVRAYVAAVRDSSFPAAEHAC